MNDDDETIANKFLSSLHIIFFVSSILDIYCYNTCYNQKKHTFLLIYYLEIVMRFII